MRLSDESVDDWMFGLMLLLAMWVIDIGREIDEEYS